MKAEDILGLVSFLKKVGVKDLTSIMDSIGAVAGKISTIAEDVKDITVDVKDIIVRVDKLREKVGE
jgi:hypothetical protein